MLSVPSSLASFHCHRPMEPVPRPRSPWVWARHVNSVSLYSDLPSLRMVRRHWDQSRVLAMFRLLANRCADQRDLGPCWEGGGRAFRDAPAPVLNWSRRLEVGRLRCHLTVTLFWPVFSMLCSARSCTCCQQRHYGGRSWSSALPSESGDSSCLSKLSC